MSSLSVQPVRILPRPTWRDWSIPSSAAAQFLLLLAAAIATRMALYGDPVIHSDEQFYLLVGDRMLHGAWPFVDIFDRKPVGLFLIYAGLQWIGGNGILIYQLAATLCAAMTAFLTMRIARRFADPDAAFAAGICYLVWLVVFDGAGGQSSVWYSLPMAGAALFTLDGIRNGRPRMRGSSAMLLVGIAMQIKYTAMFEGIFFAFALLWAGRRAGRSWRMSIGDAAIWVALALAPTALAWAVYADAGRGAVFFFANFVSIFGQRDADTVLPKVAKLVEAVALAAPLTWLAWRGSRNTDRIVLAWAGVATGAILLMHHYEQHYFIPLMLPLAVASAAGLERRPADAGAGLDVQRFATVLAIGVMLAMVAMGMRVRQRGTTAQMAELVRLVGDRPAGCVFGYNSEPILYYLTRSCLPTPYIFRSHLGQTIESKGIGVDPVAETARLLARRPGVIVMRERKKTTDPATEALVLRAVAERYRLVGVVRIGRLRQFVYRLRNAV